METWQIEQICYYENQEITYKLMCRYNYNVYIIYMILYLCNLYNFYVYIYN